jgi:hypothetical protein
MALWEIRAIGHVGRRPHRDAHSVAGDDVAVDNIAAAGEAQAERVVGEDVGGDVVVVPPVDLQAIGISFETVAHHGKIVARELADRGATHQFHVAL